MKGKELGLAIEKFKLALGDDYKDIITNLKIEDISYHQVGIRAKLEKHYDFVIEKDKRYPGCINLIGIDSPGLTSSLAIARHVKKLLGKIK